MERGVLAPLKAGPVRGLSHTALGPAATGRHPGSDGPARPGRTVIRMSRERSLDLRRLKERARILRRLLRLRPWPLALAMLMLGAVTLAVTMIGWFRAAMAPAPVFLERACFCRFTPPTGGP